MTNISSMVWGGTSAYLLTPHGIDATWDPLWPGGCAWYDYSTSYCLGFCKHPGVDITLNLGTNLYAVGDGYITCAGTNNGPGSNGGGCVGYEDDLNGGDGRVELWLDNGQVAIYGHSHEAVAPLGAHVTAGQLIARSGGSNSNHLHFELRTPNGSCGAGYAAIDPVPLLTGATPPAARYYEGDTVAVNSAGGVNLRDAPGLSSNVIALMPDGRNAIVLQGPSELDGYKWYRLETRYGRGYAAGELLEKVSLTNVLANPTANANLDKILPNRSDGTVVVSRDCTGNCRVKTENTGTAGGQGVRYESNTNLNWTGQRYFGAYIPHIKRVPGTASVHLDAIRTTVFYTDGTDDDSGAVGFTPNDDWNTIVLKTVASNPAKTIRKVALRVTMAGSNGSPFSFLTDNARVVQL